MFWMRRIMLKADFVRPALGGCPRMPFFPNSSLYSKNYPRNINYMPAVIFFVCLDFGKIGILG
jgi:hypothetical protein